ncbi:MAG: hypothetical protein E4H15_05530 [Syntrophobacterales bacterium]|nr:MAG: hypothetical protein E4H15_05530 [Syntrophobacterales bacterium]
MPAGPRLKYRSYIPKYAEFVFENVDSEFARRSLKNKSGGIFTAIIGGLSYGQGSSREHAAICPMYLGVRMVLAKSFERIHSDNLINFGILPLTFINQADYDQLCVGDPISISGVRSLVMESDTLPVSIGDADYTFRLTASQRQRSILLEGGLLNYTRKRFNT